MIWRTAGHAVLLWSVALGAQAAQRWVPPEAEPLWPRLLELTTELAGPPPEKVETIEQQILGFGRPAIRPLLGICSRELPQCPVARKLLPMFGDVLMDNVLEAGAGSGPMLVVGCDAVSVLGVPVLPRMMALIENDDTYLQEGRSFGVCVLNKMGSESIPTLMELTKSKNENARGAALSNLSIRRDARLIPLFLAGLSDPDANVRRLSAIGLQVNPDPRALSTLLEMLRSEGQIDREAAIAALGTLYSPNLRSPIALAAWTDPQLWVRRTASGVLSSTTDRVAQRLGRRYYAHRYNPNTPYYQWGPRVSCAVVFLCLAAAFGTRVRRSLGLLGAALLGVYWGGFASDHWILTEAFLLCVFIPVTTFVLWRTGGTWPIVPIALAWLIGQLMLPAVFSAPLFYYGEMITLLVNGVGLILAVPSIGLALTQTDDDPTSLKRARRVVRDVAVAFYAGYGIAFAALWGYLGF